MLSTRRISIHVMAVFWPLLLSTATGMAADLKIKGKITVDGKPLAEGKLSFHFESGQFIGSKVKDGDYKIDRVLSGKYKVTVEGKEVPAKFTSDDTTPLVVEVNERSGVFDFDLKK